MQTKRQSIIESIVQQVAGFFVGIGVQYVVFYVKDMEATLLDNLEIGVVFSLVSAIRSYVLRRVFNKQHAER
jgi:glycerol uptake facilitator-like aquaporin